MRGRLHEHKMVTSGSEQTRALVEWGRPGAVRHQYSIDKYLGRSTKMENGRTDTVYPNATQTCMRHARLPKLISLSRTDSHRSQTSNPCLLGCRVYRLSYSDFFNLFLGYLTTL
jgi:hypothetical protein